MTHAFGTQNIRHSEVKDNIQSVLHLVEKRFPAELDVLAMQELTGAHKDWITEEMPGWKLHWRQLPTNGTGLIWNSRKWRLISKGARVIYNPRTDGPVEVYEGKEQWGWRRYASWVLLQDRFNGEIASFVCVHGKLGAGGKPEQWKKLHALLKDLELKSKTVHVAGDMNTLIHDLPGWLRSAVVLSDRIDHVAVFGGKQIVSKHHISEKALNNLVDHPGAAIVWNFR